MYVEAAMAVCKQHSGCVCGERDLGEGDEIGLCGSSVPVHIGWICACSGGKLSRGLDLCP